MSPPSKLHRDNQAREIGVFSWPLDPSSKGLCSPVCARILDTAATNSTAFNALLEPVESARFEAALSQAEFEIELKLRNGRHITMNAAVDDTPGARLVCGSIEDNAAWRREIAELTVREEFCRAVAESSPAMLWMGDENGKCVFLNDAQREFWGVDPEDLSAFDWGSTVHKDDIEKLSGPFAKAMTEQIPFSVAARYRTADGQYRTLRSQANPRFDRDGNFLGMTGVNTDITDQLAAEARTRMLMGELNHRTKNIISVVQAVARQTEKHAAPDEFNRIFNERLMGLAASNDLLLRSDWTGVELDELIEVQLQHLKGLIGERIVVGGPRLRIASSAAQTLGMALHELATNSLKYGALAAADGVVHLKWDLRGDEECMAFCLRWHESGISNVVPPASKGFGHSVIVDMVAAAFEAEVDLRFESDGLKWQLTALTNCELV